jgi:acetyl esterase/lipase
MQPGNMRRPGRPQPKPGEPPEPPPMMDVDQFERKWLDVVYAKQSKMQQMDIYLPEKNQGHFPVIVAIHGGAWMICDKRDAQQYPMLEGLKRGYAIVSINYRLSHEAKFPAQIYDCKAAIRYIRAHAKEYSLDPDRIAAWGGSAGGHLSSLLGTSAGVKELEDLSMGNPSQSSAIQAVIEWFGPTESFLKMDKQFKASGKGAQDHSAAQSPESLLLGKTITQVPEMVKKASPLTYLTTNCPPFLIQHGSEDELVPVEQSIHFAEAIRRIAGKDKVIFEILKGSFHADPNFDTPQNAGRCLDFLDSVFKS